MLIKQSMNNYGHQRPEGRVVLNRARQQISLHSQQSPTYVMEPPMNQLSPIWLPTQLHNIDAHRSAKPRIARSDLNAIIHLRGSTQNPDLSTRLISTPIPIQFSPVNGRNPIHLFLGKYTLAQSGTFLLRALYCAFPCILPTAIHVSR
jgi:hypothetical protein